MKRLYRYFRKTLQFLWLALLGANLWTNRYTLIEAASTGVRAPEVSLGAAANIAAQKADIAATLGDAMGALDLIEVSARELRQENPNYDAVEHHEGTVEASFAKKKKEPPPPPPMWASEDLAPRGAL